MGRWGCPASLMTELLDAWRAFEREMRVREQRLISEIASVWADLSAQLRSVEHSAAEIGQHPSDAAPMEAIHWLFETARPRLLNDPVETYRGRKPLQRMVTAIQDYRASLADATRRLPAQVELTGPGLVALLGRQKPLPVFVEWRVRLWSKPRSIALREIVLDRILIRDLGRASLDGGLQSIAAKSALQLMQGWQSLRSSTLREHAGRQADDRLHSSPAHLEARNLKASGIIEGYGQWAAAGAKDLADSILRSPAPVSSSRRDECRRQSDRNLKFWSRQERGVDAALRLEQGVSNLGADLSADARRTLAEFDLERTKLLAELDSVLGWLEAGGTAQARDLSAPQTRLISAGERLEQWMRHVSASARKLLPESVEIVEPSSPLPTFRSPWRILSPLRVVNERLQIIANDPVEGFREVESAERAIVRDIERAREVVAFGAEVAATEGEEGERLASEARENALSLLTYQKASVPDLRRISGMDLYRLISDLLLDLSASLEKGRVGLLAHIGKQRGTQVLEVAMRATIASARKAVLATANSVEAWGQRLLTGIGLLTPPRPRLDHLDRRSSLSSVFEVQFSHRELPGLYQRLFRLSPVEDQRFLVGRQSELAALTRARLQWKANKPCSVLMVGARGSGKTSLLNCAMLSVFGGEAVVRAEFHSRLTRRAELHVFLRDILRLPVDADLVSALTEQPRVIVLEELERAFLRVIGGFHAMDALFDLIYATSHRTLWILCTNEMAFRYLKAAVELDRHFAFRINATSAAKEDLISAILQRHELSGLRLEFRISAEVSRLSRVRRLLGLNENAKEVFFDSLYDQSEGIFRAAFELWQSCIEKVEGGVVHMSQSLAPNYAALFAELNLNDYFALQAVLHHGSLTGEELAQVLCIPGEAALRLLNRLMQMELLDNEPSLPGLRIRPEATRAVRKALHRQNLSLETH
jgi:hypothetical protein